MTIFKELKLLSEKLKSENHPDYHNEARKQINLKYGKDWRDKIKIDNLNQSKTPLKMSHY